LVGVYIADNSSSLHLTSDQVDTVFNDFYGNTIDAGLEIQSNGYFYIFGLHPSAPPTPASGGSRNEMEFVYNWTIITD
jgi:hypothetical protein